MCESGSVQQAQSAKRSLATERHFAPPQHSRFTLTCVAFRCFSREKLKSCTRSLRTREGTGFSGGFQLFLDLDSEGDVAVGAEEEGVAGGGRAKIINRRWVQQERRVCVCPGPTFFCGRQRLAFFLGKALVTCASG